MKEKMKYLFWSILNCNRPKNCPSCHSKKFKCLDKKYYFTSLNECSECFLRFRLPLEKYRDSSKFYQNNYVEPDGITTLTKVEKNHIALDFGYKKLNEEIEIIKLLSSRNVEENSILDFGSSWGYQSFQFKENGFLTFSFEISKPRINYGNQTLGLNITDDINDIPNVDVFYSSHVIEHMENPLELLNIAKSKTKNGGLIYLKCPNGSREFQVKSPEVYKKMWGLVHPNFITAEWISNVIKPPRSVMFVSSLEGEELLREVKNWDRKLSYLGNLENPNLTILYFSEDI